MPAGHLNAGRVPAFRVEQAKKARAGWEIHAAGVDLFLHQQGIDTTTPGGKAMFQMLGVFAEFERSIIQKRVRAGLRRAKAEGKRLGRPRVAANIEARISAALKARKDTGDSVRKIAARFGVDPRARCFLPESGFPMRGISDSNSMLGNGGQHG
jgi:Resolvase, N terminal domain